jgi:hypothetical protein
MFLHRMGTGRVVIISPSSVDLQREIMADFVVVRDIRAVNPFKWDEV